MSHPLYRGAAVLAALWALPAAARAQAGVPDTAAVEPASSLACVRALPPAAFARSPVFVHAEVLDSADAAARPAVDVIAQEAAVSAQGLLRGPVAAAAAQGAPRLPAIDWALGRVAYPEGRVRLVARRGGQLTWRLDHARGADTAAVALIARALRAANDQAPLFVLDDLIRGDSVAFAIEFAHPYAAGPRGRLEIRVRNPTPAFTALLPQEKQAGLNGGLPLRYPADLQRGGFEGKVIVSFVVDTAGRAEPRTFRDVYPEVAASLRPNLRGAYALFLGAVRDAVLRARFFPAEVGGCHVRQLVQLPVSFQLAR